jgi:hypothetical protein
MAWNSSPATGLGLLRDMQGMCDLCGRDCYPNDEVRGGRGAGGRGSAAGLVGGSGSGLSPFCFAWVCVLLAWGGTPPPQKPLDP